MPLWFFSYFLFRI